MDILSTIDCRQFASVGIPAFVAVIGWFYVHKLNAQRDLASKRREARIKALEAAYLRIATHMNRPLNDKAIEAIETFVAEIQLYGTPKQITLMQEIVEEFKKPNNVVYYDALLVDLRDTIRQELDMEKVSGLVWWLRFENHTVENTANNSLKGDGPCGPRP